MFLFTTPQSQSRETQPANPVVSAIRQGAERTGAGFDYLLKTAQRESSLEPTAKATSTGRTRQILRMVGARINISRRSGGG